MASSCHSCGDPEAGPEPAQFFQDPCHRQEFQPVHIHARMRASCSLLLINTQFAIEGLRQLDSLEFSEIVNFLEEVLKTFISIDFDFMRF